MRPFRLMIAVVFVVPVVSAFGDEERPFRNTPAKTELAADRVEVPFEMRNAHIAVDVMVNGKGPFQFLVDTGAAGCGRISEELAKELNLSETGEVNIGDPSGQNRTTAKLVGVDSIAVGGATFYDCSLLRRGQALPMKDRFGVDGILGIGLFRDCLWTLDYVNRKMIVERGALPEADGVAVLEYSDRNGVVEIPIKVDGIEVRADVDSGSMGGLTLPKSVTDKLKFKREPVVVGKAKTGFTEFEIREGRIDGEVRVGGAVVRDPVVAVNEVFPQANIGGRFLDGCRLTIDQANHRLRLVREQDGELAAGPRYRVGIMMKHGDGEVAIDGVVPDGPAARAGLKAGDRITHVNGEEIETVSQDQMRKVFGSPESIKLTIKRGEEELEIALTPEAVE